MTGMQAGLLDNIRISNGPDSLRSYFNELLHTDREKLLELLNDRNLQFCSLYILKQDIHANSLQKNLPQLYGKALEITDELSGNINASHNTRPSRRTFAGPFRRMQSRPAAVMAGWMPARAEKKIRLDTQAVTPALEWIVETGWDSELCNSTYELFMERCTALLLKDFRKGSVLPAVAESIFARNRQGKLIHNLVWAFFEALDPDSLYLLVQRLASTDRRDAALAKKLLCFIPGLEEAAGTAAYYRAMQWLSENRPYLCFTGESMQMCSRPVYYTVSLEAKYLCRPVSADSGRPLSPLLDNEIKLLTGFRELPETDQRQLADFSCMLHRRDIYQWDSWIRMPVARQAGAVSEITGGSA